jgi:hypothetical protein
VLLVPPDTAALPDQIRTVLVPLMGHNHVEQQVGPVAIGFSHTNAMLMLISIISGSAVRTENRETAGAAPDTKAEEAINLTFRLQLLNVASSLRRDGIRSTWEVRYGDEVEEIIRAAETTSADIIAFSRRGVAAQQFPQFSGTVLTIARKASIPVLVLPVNTRKNA